MEHRIGTSTTRIRWPVLLAVVVLHVLFLYAIQRLRAHRPATHDRTDAALVMVRIERPLVPEPVRDSVREEDPVVREQREQRRAGGSIDTQSSAPPTAPRSIDWRANAARSAQIVAEGSLEEEHRSFGPRKEPERAARAPESVFGPGPKHQPGEIGVDPYDDPAIWLNDSCYQELDKPVPTARDLFTIVPLVKCMMSIGSREPNGKLFEHIKKREEPPVPKAGTEMNPLPERDIKD